MPSSTISPSSFTYVVQPTPNGERFMPRAQYRGTKTTAEVMAELDARIAGQTLTTELIVKALMEVIIDFNKYGWKVEPIFDLLGFRFGVGNTFDHSGFPATFENLAISPNANFGTLGEARARDGFSGEKHGEQVRVSAVFLSVTDTYTRDTDHYTHDKNLEIELANKRFRFEPGNADHWVKFKMTDGTVLAASGYQVRGSTIVARVPSSLDGNVELHLSCEINSSVRVTVYQHMLMP